jgi:hypothetical protein
VGEDGCSWFCLPFGFVESGCVRPSGLWNLVLSALWIVESGFVRPSGLWNLVLSALRV